MAEPVDATEGRIGDRSVPPYTTCCPTCGRPDSPLGRIGISQPPTDQPVPGGYEQAVEAAAKVLFEQSRDALPPIFRSAAWETATEQTRNAWRPVGRAAVDAALPLLVSPADQAVLDAVEHWFDVVQRQIHGDTWWKDAVHADDDLADAIRTRRAARREET